VLHAQQDAKHVGIESGRKALGGLLRDRTNLALGCRIVDGDVEATEARDGLRDKIADIVFFATSARTYSASEPSERNSSASASPASSRRPETTTLAPFLAKANAAARPIPVSAPVTRATLFFMGPCP
jgi:hypothetical protein